MCLIAFAWNVHPRWRLVLVGNRDEFHARPSAGLARWDDAPLIAGRDLRAGGTWLGVTAQGRCAVVTNVRTPASMGTQSRGLLVGDYLADAGSAATHSDKLVDDAAAYGPFNLLLFDAQEAWLVGNHPQPHRRPLDHGVHALSNADLDTPWPKVCALDAQLHAWLADGGADPLALLVGLRDEHVASDAQLPDTGFGLERERQLSPAFIRGHEYGTRASTVVAIAHDGSGMIVEHRFGVDGVSCGQTRVDFVAALASGS
ncbi:MAG: NRDE family protein [Rhodanobacter sp.]